MNTLAIVMVIVLIAFTIGLSIFSRRFTRTTADFYLAGRKVGSFANASAISGDYLSAASFLGVAGAVYASGLDGVWFAAGFAGGFMVVIIFIASALRRFGEYTIADFAFGRFGTSRIRLVAVLCVLLISLFYMAPQMFGSGTTWKVLVGQGILGLDPYTSGVVVVTVIMAFYVGMGGMKGTTLNQIFQFWWLWFAMFLVIAFAFGKGFNYSQALSDVSADGLRQTKTYTVTEFEAPITNPDGSVAMDDQGNPKTPMSVAKANMSEASFTQVMEAVDKAKAEGTAGTTKVDVVIPAKSKLKNQAGELRTMLFNSPGHRYNAFDQFSMVLALVLGTAGLPHILNRYYTNPSGSAARRSTFWVLVFIGTFYIMAPIAGLAARIQIPEALAAGTAPTNTTYVDYLLQKSDALMPTLAQILGGEALLGVVAAGAFAAMFSTIGGLLIAAASAIGHDVYEKYVNPNASEAKRVMVGKMSVIAFALIAMAIGLGIPATGLDKAYPALIAMMVTWAFSVSASAFVPMLVLGIWWRGTTERGAIAGVLVGLVGSITIILMNILQALKIIGTTGLLGFVGSLTFPVLFTFPLGVLTIIIVSMIDGQLPKNVDEIWMRIHGTAHERHERDLGLDKIGGLLGGGSK